jgi:hypothetical protein
VELLHSLHVEASEKLEEGRTMPGFLQSEELPRQHLQLQKICTARPHQAV